jgi:hypothetical protein
LALIVGYSALLDPDELQFFRINERNRDYFISIIADNVELAERIRDQDLRFLDIQSYVHEYNEWAKNQKK